MLYKLFMNYLKVKMTRAVLARIFGKKFIKSKKLKTISMLTYAFELFRIFKGTKKPIKATKTRR